MNVKKLLILILSSLFVLSCNGNNMTFYENEDNLKPEVIIPYPDNTVIFHLVKKLNETCYEPRLMFRIIYPNNTSNFITVLNHNIPTHNFCSFIDGINVDLVGEKMLFLKTIQNYIFLIYGNFTNTFGMVIDWNGNIKSDTLLGDINIFDSSYFENNIEDRQEHTFFESILDSPDILMKKFIIMPDEGELVKIQENRIKMPKDYEKFNIYRTINFDFLFTFIYTSTTGYNTITQNTLSLQPDLYIYGSILQKDTSQLSDLFLVYQTAISSIKLSAINCVQFYDGNGFYCIIEFANSVDSTMIKVTFLSNGKIIETERETYLDSVKSDVFSMNVLKSGVLVIGTLKYDVQGCNITAFLLGSNNQWVNADSNPKSYTDYPCYARVLNNGTAIYVPEKKEKYWTLSTFILPNVMYDNGYKNPIINWTIPAIRGIIPLETNQIQISYNIPIQCSSKNIYIYQKLGDKDVLRESYSAQSNNCQVLSDNTTLLLDILPSTFNQPNSSYYIKVDTNFVKQNRTLEPLFGILENTWVLKTKPHEYTIDDSVSGFLRLTYQGTLYFESLSLKEKIDFIQNLISQLAGVIPIPLRRIKSDNRYQVDTKGTSPQTLINIQILNSDTVSELNVASIVKYLDMLVKNNETTPISANNFTSMLDNTYGFQTYRSFIDIITIPVIVMATIILLLIICYLWARKRYREGKNFTIIITAFMLHDFIMDLLFIFDLKNKNLSLLFGLNLIFTIPPIILNLFTAIYIISQENAKNIKFYNYFIENTTIVSIISVIAGTDIGVLHILSSNFANLSVFSAKFSKKAEDYIFWCALIGFLFEDIPQFGVQIAYNVSRVEYTIIPALTLISNTLMLLINITVRLHGSIIRCRNPPSENTLQRLNSSESSINIVSSPRMKRLQI